MMSSPTKRTPEELLRQVEAEEKYARRGKLKVFLGYASGVGKSFTMFDEGRRRRERGQDVVVGAVQPKTSAELDDLIRRLEVIPQKTVGEAPVMDTETILRRRPQVCLVDGLAYDNPPGSPHAHRWQDVEQLLNAGISVITTINLQYVEERRQEVERIRGKRVTVSVPESFLRQADDIVVVDAPAESCRDRADGSGMDDTVTESAAARQQKLSQLREIALLLAADVVDDQLEKYAERHGLAQTWGMQERILVCVTPRANAARMIERGRLIRDRFHGELFVLYVGQAGISSDDQIALERNLALARDAGAEIKLLHSEDPVPAIIDFAREHGITQIFIGHSLDERWWARFTRTTVDRLIQHAEDIDVKLFPH